ncbi:MAG: ABC transporter substrate-binding protein [Thiomargarita sp.]|nr:ABC transporter substrate-binding protein [Thiomargarita sp.]
MPFNHTIIVYNLLGLVVLFLSACDFRSDITSTDTANSNNDKNQTTPLTFAVAPKVTWMPWYLANEEGRFENAKMNVPIKFISGNYKDLIDKFITEEIHAIAISNIDAIAQIVRRDIQADVILITSNHIGNEGILLPHNAETDIRGKTIGLVQHSAPHYLFDRYLIRHQIPFEKVNILNTAEMDVSKILSDKTVDVVVTGNPELYQLVHVNNAKILFDSRQIPTEIFDLIVVRRSTLIEHPEFAQTLVSAWFSVMKRLQGNKKGRVVDTMANLAQISPQECEEQLTTVSFNDTPTKALAAIRDRRLKKTMRYIRYFIERQGLIENKPFTEWVSYPGREPALLHFNGQPLQKWLLP